LRAWRKDSRKTYTLIKKKTAWKRSTTSKPIVHIGKVVRNAMVFNAQRWPGAPFAMDELLQKVNNLFSLLQQQKVKYVLVEGIALLQYIVVLTDLYTGWDGLLGGHAPKPHRKAALRGGAAAASPATLRAYTTQLGLL
jgi:hypothetical protein